MSLRVRLASKRKPEGWATIETALYEFEDRMREAINDPHDGKRKAESQWPIHRLHWERNRYIYDLYYKQAKISRELYDFLVREKIADAALISKWRKPGYEILCSMAAIQKGSTNFGTTSICRVPLAQRGSQIMPSVQTGCVSCVSGDGIDGGPVWWTDPYTAWAAKKKADKKQKRAEATIDPEVEARLKALRGAGPPGGGSTAGVGSGLDEDVEARLAALRGNAPPPGGQAAPGGGAQAAAFGACAPPPSGAGRGGGGAAVWGGEFMPSPTFAGARPGFVFKKGANGVGYYSDR
jgi:bud site selection protein 31